MMMLRTLSSCYYGLQSKDAKMQVEVSEMLAPLLHQQDIA